MVDGFEVQATSCRLCGGARHHLVFSAADFDTGTERLALLRCDDCGLVRTDPPCSTRELGAWYSHEYYGHGHKKFAGPGEWVTRLMAQRRARGLAAALQKRTSRIKRPLRVLDVGCGRALMLSSLAAMGWECHGIERDDFPASVVVPGVAIHRGSVTDAGFPDSYFDLVIVWHALEHVPDPVALLATVRRVMQPLGSLAIAVPNFGSSQAALFRRHWFHLDLPRHRHHFTVEALSSCLTHCGFVPGALTTFALEQNFYGFLQSALNRLFPRKVPNRLYALLRGGEATPSEILEGCGWLALSAVIAPVALAEALCAPLFGRGATLTLLAAADDPPQ